MKSIMKLLFFPVILFSVIACSKKDSAIMSLDEIIDNNKQLSFVIEKYKNDTLKLKAAKFLIENLPYHSSYEGKAIDNYIKLYELYGTGKYSPEEVLDSISSKYGKFSYTQAYLKKDLYISYDYMIDNIDWAFKVWKEQPWGKNVTFENFCEYILPYRVGDERLAPWREEIYTRFNPLLDSIRSLPEAEDPLFVCQVLLDSLKQKPFYFTSFFDGPHVGPNITKWGSGNCRESTDILIYIFRALGIPCGKDFMILRGDNNVGHEWNFVLDKNGENYFCSLTYASGKVEATHLYWNPKGKVYRETFSLNREMMDEFNTKSNKIYPLFRYPLFKDVTRYYTDKFNRALTISKDMMYEKPLKGKIVYLCSASWMEWLPIAYTVCNNVDSIQFKDVEGGIVFRLAAYDNDRLYPLTDPFILEKETDKILFFRVNKEKENVILFHKFQLFFDPFDERMIGGVFEGSDRIDFVQKDTLYMIKEKPIRLYNTVVLNNNKKYRYIRYMGPANSHCNVSEVSFFDNSDNPVSLNGKSIGTPNNDQTDGKHEFKNAFDGDPYTSFDYYLPNGGWTGLALMKNQPIRKIIYTPRNRDNFIHIGDQYELYYFQNKNWISAGKIIAESDSLIFNVPKGALLYLKNHTRGSDERIFEYADGKQKYW